MIALILIIVIVKQYRGCIHCSYSNISIAYYDTLHRILGGVSPSLSCVVDCAELRKMAFFAELNVLEAVFERKRPVPYTPFVAMLLYSIHDDVSIDGHSSNDVVICYAVQCSDMMNE